MLKTGFFIMSPAGKCDLVTYYIFKNCQCNTSHLTCPPENLLRGNLVALTLLLFEEEVAHPSALSL